MAAERRPGVLTARVRHAEERRRAGVARLFRVHRVGRPVESAVGLVEAVAGGDERAGAVGAAAGTAPAGGEPAGAAFSASAPSTVSGGAADPVTVLGSVVAWLESLGGTLWHEVSGQGAHDVLDLVVQAERRLAAVRAQVLQVVEGNGLWATSGARTFPVWLRHRTGASAGGASRQVRQSRALRDDLPLAYRALAAGRIGEDHVAVLVREATRTAELRAALSHPEVGEGFLVEQAAVMDAGTFNRLVRQWAIAADPGGADRAWREVDAKEELTISATTGGFHVKGWLDEVSGQVVCAALKAHAGRKGAGDERTAAQRRAAALVSLAHQSLDEGRQGASARVRPHLTVTVSLELLRALAAASGSAIPSHRFDGAPYDPGAAFGAPADAALTALGGPREPHTTALEPSGEGAAADGSLFGVSPQTMQWLQAWRPGDDHVISTALDHQVLVGLEAAVLEDGTPISPGLLARLACESQLARVVFGAQSTILDAGREKRLFPANQARAIIARDKHCQYPGCDEPPGFGEIHHSLWWAKHHGATDAEHGILLCWHHHDWVHTHQITITRSTGRWYFHDRNGWRLTPHGTNKP